MWPNRTLIWPYIPFEGSLSREPIGLSIMGRDLPSQGPRAHAAGIFHQRIGSCANGGTSLTSVDLLRARSLPFLGSSVTPGERIWTFWANRSYYNRRPQAKKRVSTIMPLNSLACGSLYSTERSNSPSWYMVSEAFLQTCRL